MHIVRTFPDSRWDESGPTHDVEQVVEAGHVLSFPQLAFPLDAAEQGFLDPAVADPKVKNVSLRWPGGELRGAANRVQGAESARLQALIRRYAEHSEALVLRLFPHYRGHLRRGNTSLRPFDVAGRASSWRKDDTRLHVDAFPSNPTHGTRLLRVFSNVNPDGQPRRWRVGESFEAHASRYLPAIARPLPGSAWLMEMTGITKRRRSEYDHVMLQLHDRAKADAEYQRDGAQQAVEFAPGTTWVCYSDQLPHAAMGGQHMLEQTFYLEVEHLQRPETSPLRTLERLLGRALLPG